LEYSFSSFITLFVYLTDAFSFYCMLKAKFFILHSSFFIFIRIFAAGL